MKQQGINVTSYMTLAYGKALKDPIIQEIANHNQQTPAQVILAWALAKGYAVIPSSTKRENLASNLAAQGITLSDEQLMKIDQLDTNSREVNPEVWHLFGIHLSNFYKAADNEKNIDIKW